MWHKGDGQELVVMVGLVQEQSRILLCESYKLLRILSDISEYNKCETNLKTHILTYILHINLAAALLEIDESLAK